MNIKEAIERYISNAEFERTHGNLQGCLEFKQLAEWLTILSDVYSVINEYDIAFHRDREDLTSMEIDILRALKI